MKSNYRLILHYLTLGLWDQTICVAKSDINKNK